MRRKNKQLNAFKRVFVFFILLIGLTLAFSVPGTLAAAKGNEGKGRYYFRQNCKSCHIKGATGGEVTPLSKTQAQWRTYFKTGKHSKRTELLTKTLTEEQLRDVETFLVNHAADSLQPETCGK